MIIIIRFTISSDFITFVYKASYRVNRLVCSLLRCRMICLVHLQSSFNALHKAEENCETKYSHSDPERVPMGFVPSVIPELRNGSRFRLIESFLQAHQSVAPVDKVCSAAIVGHHNFTIK